jgi:large subunit ribosomal protein L4
VEALVKWGGPSPTLVALAADEAEAAKSFRNLPAVTVLPVEAVGVADLIAAASMVVSEAALDALTARAKGETAAARSESEAA